MECIEDTVENLAMYLECIMIITCVHREQYITEAWLHIMS